MAASSLDRTFRRLMLVGVLLTFIAILIRAAYPLTFYRAWTDIVLFVAGIVSFGFDLLDRMPPELFIAGFFLVAGMMALGFLIAIYNAVKSIFGS